jgi:hypothetical protein
VGVGDGGAGGDLPPARIYSAGVASASRRRVVAASCPGLVLREGREHDWSWVRVRARGGLKEDHVPHRSGRVAARRRSPGRNGVSRRAGPFRFSETRYMLMLGTRKLETPSRELNSAAQKRGSRSPGRRPGLDGPVAAVQRLGVHC